MAKEISPRKNPQQKPLPSYHHIVKGPSKEDLMLCLSDYPEIEGELRFRYVTFVPEGSGFGGVIRVHIIGLKRTSLGSPILDIRGFLMQDGKNVSCREVWGTYSVKDRHGDIMIAPPPPSRVVAK